MTDQPPVLLLDTNIWLDNYLGNRPGSSATFDLIDYALSENMTLAYASTSTKDLFYIIANAAKTQVRKENSALSDEQAHACSSIAWGCIENMTEIAVAVPVGEPQIWLARHFRSLHEDYEDDLVLAAVETSKADYFVTGGKRLSGACGIPTFNATEMLAFLRMQEQL